MIGLEMGGGIKEALSPADYRSRERFVKDAQPSTKLRRALDSLWGYSSHVSLIFAIFGAIFTSQQSFCL